VHSHEIQDRINRVQIAPLLAFWCKKMLYCWGLRFSEARPKQTQISDLTRATTRGNAVWLGTHLIPVGRDFNKSL
jgi:hypothetical protein